MYRQPWARCALPMEGRHGMAFDLNAYETVAERLQRAHQDHPDLRIITRILETVRDPATLRPIQYIVESSVYYGDVLKAVDVAEEMVGSSPVNKYSALENCSTSAAGRALSMAGYLGIDPNSKKPTRPTRNEMEKVERAKSAAVEVKPKPALSAEDYARAAGIIATIPFITTKDELRSIYKDNEKILEIKVDGTTLLDAINKRVAELA